MNQTNPILSIKDLNLEYRQDRGIARVLNGINISLDAGKSIGVVGESGCGKTTTFYQVMRLGTGIITGGAIEYVRRSGEKVDIIQMKENSKEIRQIRG